jgi:hypothetical protein
LLAVTGGLLLLLPVLPLLLLLLLLLFDPQFPAVVGGLFELLVVVLQLRLTSLGAIAFGAVGASLHAVSNTAAIRTPADRTFILAPGRGISEGSRPDPFSTQVNSHLYTCWQ